MPITVIFPPFTSSRAAWKEQNLHRRRHIGPHGEFSINLHLLTQLSTSFLIMLIILIPFTIQANENPEGQIENSIFSLFTYGGELDFNSRYVWRGIALSEGTVMQPTVWVSAFDLTLEVWGNFVLNDEPNQGEFNEVNLIVYYSREWENITIEPAVIIYLYPNQEDAPVTAEGSLKLSYSMGPIDVYTSHIFDFVEYGGSYFGDAGLSYEHEFNTELSLEASTSLGWASAEFNEVNIGVSKSALNVAGGDLHLTYYLKEHVYIRPHVELSAIVDADLRREVDDPTILNAGLAVGMEF